MNVFLQQPCPPPYFQCSIVFEAVKERNKQWRVASYFYNDLYSHEQLKIL